MVVSENNIQGIYHFIKTPLIKKQLIQSKLSKCSRRQLLKKNTSFFNLT